MKSAPELFCIEKQTYAEKPYHYRECGLDNVHLLNGFTIEEADGEEWISVENVEGLWKAIGLNLVLKQKVLSPKEVRFLRRQMELSQADLAKLLRVDDQTLARWEKGKAKLPGPADLALRAHYLGSDPAQPEGSEILQKWMEIVTELVESDQTADRPHLYERENSGWTERPAA